MKPAAARQCLQEVDELAQPVPGAAPLSFRRKYARSYVTQYLACLWKFNKTCKL